VDLQPPSNVNIVSNFKFSQDWELLDSITPPFECFSNGVLKDPVPKKPSLPKWLAKKVSMYQCFEAGHNIVSHRLSLLFPKLRLSNFMISSLASAIFVQCPPKKMCTIEPPRPCRATAAIQAVGPIMPCLLLLAGWPVTRPACWSESLYNYSHAYTVPGASPSTTSHVFEADKLLSIHNHLFLFTYISKLKKHYNKNHVQIHSLYQKLLSSSN